MLRPPRHPQPPTAPAASVCPALPRPLRPEAAPLKPAGPRAEYRSAKTARNPAPGPSVSDPLRTDRRTSGGTDAPPSASTSHANVRKRFGRPRFRRRRHAPVPAIASSARHAAAHGKRHPPPLRDPNAANGPESVAGGNVRGFRIMFSNDNFYEINILRQSFFQFRHGISRGARRTPSATASSCGRNDETWFN